METIIMPLRSKESDWPDDGNDEGVARGSWYSTRPALVRAADRDAATPDTHNTGMGFRCVAAESGPQCRPPPANLYRARLRLALPTGW